MRRIPAVLLAVSIHAVAAQAGTRAATPGATFDELLRQAPALHDGKEPHGDRENIREPAATAAPAILKAAYARYYAATQAVALQNEILGLLQMHAQSVRQRHAAGRASRHTPAQAQARVDEQRRVMDAAQLEMNLSRNRLNALLGWPPEKRIAPPRHARLITRAQEAQYIELGRRIRATNPQLFKRASGTLFKSALADSGRYPDLPRDASIHDALRRVVRVPLRPDALRQRGKDKGDLRLDLAFSELMLRLAYVSSPTTPRTNPNTPSAADVRNRTRATFASYRRGKESFDAVLDMQIQARTQKLEKVKDTMNRQIHLAEIERLLGEKL